MLLTLQIPDARGDRTVDKKTWTVMFGVRPIVLLCSAMVVVSFGLGIASPAWGAPVEVAWAWTLLTPVGLFLLYKYAKHDHRRPAAFDRLAFLSVALFFLAIVAHLAGISADLLA
jgi:4-hydroxybenzoate polyprenyltransferase